MTSYARYWFAMIRYALVGSRAYYAWVGALVVGVVIGGIAYGQQLQHGLVVTNLSDQVSWGAYIANFTFLVGVAAAAVLLVVPSYVYGNADIKKVVLVGELMAFSALIMCMAFVVVDIGRPDRAWHMMPGVVRLNLPRSMLAWDVVVLSGYLLLNAHIPGYMLYAIYQNRAPRAGFYVPLALLSILWAVSIHTVTAFLYSGFAGRPYWNTAILAPRFLVSAFASGPALLIVVFTAIERAKLIEVPASVVPYLRRIICFTLPLNFFLLACELFTEFYTDSAHAASAHYLYFGLHGQGLLVPYIWTGLALGLGAMVIFLSRNLADNRAALVVASVMCIVGIWIEKGMGLIIPGFVPSPAGDLVQYAPSFAEFLICAGIWCLGALLFTVLVRVALAILEGRLRQPDASRASVDGPIEQPA